MKKIALLGFLCFSHGVFAQQPADKYYLIKAGKIYDAENNRFVKEQQILIKNNTIEAVGSKVDAPAGVVVIDAGNATVTPGLIDAHTHLLTMSAPGENLAADALMHDDAYRVLRAAGFAKSYLDAGFTTIRDVGNSGQYLDCRVSSAIARGYIAGPEMHVSGPIISGEGGQFYQLPFHVKNQVAAQEYRVVNGVEDAVKAVKEHVNHGADLIKICANSERINLTPDEIAAIVKTAHEYGLKVTAHATADPFINMAVKAGVDGIEHGYYITDSTLELMAEKNVYLVATDPSARLMVKSYKLMGNNNYTTEDAKKEIAVLPERISRALKKGVLVVAGSDQYIDYKDTYGNLAKEAILSYYDAVGAATALRFATWNAAIILNAKDRKGVIKKGAAADLVIFNGDMEQNFEKTLYDVKSVFIGGKMINP